MTQIHAQPRHRSRRAEPAVELRPPGERYFRHPGDVVRLVLWGAATFVLVVFIGVATGTSDGVTDRPRPRRRAAAGDGPRAPPRPRCRWSPSPCPVAVVAGLVATPALAPPGDRRSSPRPPARRAFWAPRHRLRSVRAVPGAVTTGTWVASPRFPSLAYVAGRRCRRRRRQAVAVAAVAAGRRSRRARCSSLVMAIGGTAGVPELLAGPRPPARRSAPPCSSCSGRRTAGRRPPTCRAALRSAGVEVDALDARSGPRAGGPSSTRRPAARRPRLPQGVRPGQPRRRPALPRLPDRSSSATPATSGRRRRSPTTSSTRRSSCMLAARAGVACPAVAALAALPDGSMVLAMEHVDGPPLDELDAGRARRRAPRRGLARGRSCCTPAAWPTAPCAPQHPRRPTVGPVVVDLGFGQESASARLQAIDRAELLASLAAARRASTPTVASARRVIGPTTSPPRLAVPPAAGALGSRPARPSPRRS